MPDNIRPANKTDWERAIRRCAQVRYDEYGDEVLTAKLINVLRENEKICREEGRPATQLRLCPKPVANDESNYPPWGTQYHRYVEDTHSHPNYTAPEDVLDRLRKKIREHMDQSRLI